MRFTSNKNGAEMEIYELAHNSCYIRDGYARFRWHDLDMDARALARNLLDKFADIPNEFICDDDFDEYMVCASAMQYGSIDDMLGLIAIFYWNLWAMADLREQLKDYEDLAEQGKLLKLPCAVGDTVWDNGFGQPCRFKVTGFSFGEIDDDEDDDDIKELRIHYRNQNGSVCCSCAVSEIGKTVFLAKSEAEAAL